MLHNGRVKLNLLIYRFVVVFVLLFCVGIGVGSAQIAYDTVFEKTMDAPVRFLLPILLSGMIIVFIMLLFRWFECFSETQLKIVTVFLFVTMSAIFAVLLCNLHPVPTTDPLHLTNKALEIIDTGKVPIAWT